MTRKLILGPELALPLDAVTETFGILAVRGAGKSNTAAVMAEEMFAKHLPFVVVDPVGSWWGLRSNRKGSGPGLAIPIFGGRHGDVPLERGGGQLVADLVVDQRLSIVLDLSTFDSENAKKQFLLDFAVRLYRRNEAPLHLFLEEADDYIPQRPIGQDDKYLLRAWENIVRRGRARGLGITLITQRSAVLNKNVLTQVQTLIAMRTTGPQDRKAIEEWVKYHAQSLEIVKSLPSLEDGEAWVWSPEFLGKTIRAQIRRRQTFDSGATPRHSAPLARQPATLADVDLKKFQKQMSETIERAKLTDPKLLQRENARLRDELKKANTFMDLQQPVKTKEVVKKVTVTVFQPALIKRLEKTADRLLKMQNSVTELGADIRSAINRARAPLVAQPPAQIIDAKKGRISVPPTVKTVRLSTADTNGKIPSGEREILKAAAQHPNGITRTALTQITGYKESTRNAYIARSVTAGRLILQGNLVMATNGGIAELGVDFEPLPTGSALREYWIENLPEGESVLFSLICKAYPLPISVEKLSEESSYKESTRNAYLARLVARQLIRRDRGQAQAHRELFDA